MLLKPDGGELYVISPKRMGCRRSIPGRTRWAITCCWARRPRMACCFRCQRDVCYGYGGGSRGSGGHQQSPRRAADFRGAGAGGFALRFERPRRDTEPVVGGESRLGRSCVIGLRAGSQSLLTMIPVGTKPQDLAVKLF